jgi:RNA polymerase-interacting CarD/CdnL/TRCF family regulator
MRLKITGLAYVIIELHKALKKQEKKGIDNRLGHKLLTSFKLEMTTMLGLDNENVKAALRLI